MNRSTIEMRVISIAFFGVQVLSNVNFSVSTGSTHALIGANGAGKSTLMKILSGAYPHYTGTILIDDKPVKIKTPQDAKRYGVETVYQEVDIALIPELSVAENIMLDATVYDMGRRQFVNWKALFAQAEAVLKRLHIDIPLRKKASELTIAQKQLVLIARALSRKCRFLILDEPTAPLSVTETDVLFEIVNHLKANGVGIVFISHRLPELFKICDDITVLRDGALVTKKSTDETDQNELVSLMLGRKTETFQRRQTSVSAQKALEATHLTDHRKLHDISFHANRGEIVGVTGLVGAGKTELCDALFGVTRVSGIVKVNEKPLRTGSVHAAVKSGLGLIPEERYREGLFPDGSVCDNLTVTQIGRLCKFGAFLDFPKIKKTAQEICAKLHIKTESVSQKITHLSGGNQQKAVVGKWLATDASVLIFDEPTKGVDVHSKNEIYAIVEEFANGGKAVIYASCEFREILAVSDRILVLYDGKVAKEIPASEASEEMLLYYATGGQ